VDVGKYGAQGVVLNQRNKVIAADREPGLELPEPAIGTQVCKDGLSCIPTLLRVGLGMIRDQALSGDPTNREPGSCAWLASTRSKDVIEKISIF
jgi:hypothetical protein